MAPWHQPGTTTGGRPSEAALRCFQWSRAKRNSASPPGDPWSAPEMHGGAAKLAHHHQHFMWQYVCGKCHRMYSSRLWML